VEQRRGRPIMAVLHGLRANCTWIIPMRHRPSLMAPAPRNSGRPRRRERWSRIRIQPSDWKGRCVGVRRVQLAAAVTAVSVAAVALWWRRHPSACPYGQRFWVEAPHPFITRARLREALAPRPGETVLELGPGTGYYSLLVAQWLGPRGRLHLLDLQQEMLDHTMRRARKAGLGNVEPRRGDARRLPYPDAAFDAAYLVTVLGEIPDQDTALRELRRVIKPGGRVVVGELLGDPHMVGERMLRRRAMAAGLTLERRVGPPFGYFGVLRP
jgi:SAM-dependent methyltransferase